MIMTCAECPYFYECEGSCIWEKTPDDLSSREDDIWDEEDDWMPEISAEDYAEWCGKGWLY